MGHVRRQFGRSQEGYVIGSRYDYPDDLECVVPRINRTSRSASSLADASSSSRVLPRLLAGHSEDTSLRSTVLIQAHRGSCRNGQFAGKGALEPAVPGCPFL